MGKNSQSSDNPYQEYRHESRYQDKDVGGGKMKYMLLIYANQAEAPHFNPETQQAAMQAWYDFTAEAEAAGVLVANDGLAPITDARSVRVRDGKTLISDGPFAETHEQLGGYYMLDCKDLDEAIAWAAKIPGANYGTIEVRPVMTFTQG